MFARNRQEPLSALQRRDRIHLTQIVQVSPLVDIAFRPYRSAGTIFWSAVIADQGIDGRIYFHEGDTAKTKQIILSVKAGKLHAPYVRDLRGVVEREQAAIGVLLSLDEPTKAMRTEAASAGFYKSPWGQHWFPSARDRGGPHVR